MCDFLLQCCCWCINKNKRKEDEDDLDSMQDDGVGDHSAFNWTPQGTPVDAHDATRARSTSQPLAVGQMESQPLADTNTRTSQSRAFFPEEDAPFAPRPTPDQLPAYDSEPHDFPPRQSRASNPRQ